MKHLAFKIFALLLPLTVLARDDGFERIRGRVLQLSEEEGKGHYEVGLFQSVGEDGLPVGYPIVQEILPAGRNEFQLRAPSRLARSGRAYLFAEFVNTDTGARTWIRPALNPWDFHVGYAELSHREPQPRDEKSTTDWVLRGRVGTLFTGGAGVPQEGVLVKLRGRSEHALTDVRGEFALSLPVLRGQVVLELTKNGFHPSVLSVPAGMRQPVRTRLASRHAFEQISQRLGSLQESALGVVLGKSAVPGLRVQLTLEADGPFYFDDRGVPTRDLRAASSDGRFVFLNVKPGAGFLEAELDGEAIAPVRISLVEGGQLLQKNLRPTQGTISGFLYDAVAKGGPAPLAGARVRLEGAPDFVPTDSVGAFQFTNLRWMKGEPLTLMFSAAHFHSHRYSLSAEISQPVQLFAFPSSYLERLAERAGLQLDKEAGIVMGKSPGSSIRVDALADHANINRTKDFYFDARGKMRPSPASTEPRFGTFLLYNVPPGRALLLGNDDHGQLRYSHSVYAGASVVNVELDEDSNGANRTRAPAP